jgi:hypothetical protein
VLVFGARDQDCPKPGAEVCRLALDTKDRDCHGAILAGLGACGGLVVEFGEVCRCPFAGRFLARRHAAPGDAELVRDDALWRALEPMPAVWAQVLVGAAVALQDDHKVLGPIYGFDGWNFTPLLRVATVAHVVLRLSVWARPDGLVQDFFLYFWLLGSALARAFVAACTVFSSVTSLTCAPGGGGGNSDTAGSAGAPAAWACGGDRYLPCPPATRRPSRRARTGERANCFHFTQVIRVCDVCPRSFFLFFSLRGHPTTERWVCHAREGALGGARRRRRSVSWRASGAHAIIPPSRAVPPALLTNLGEQEIGRGTRRLGDRVERNAERYPARVPALGLVASIAVSGERSCSLSPSRATSSARAHAREHRVLLGHRRVDTWMGQSRQSHAILSCQVYHEFR